MCGRYSIITTAQDIAEYYGVENHAATFVKNPNISPGELAPVITNKNPNKLELFTFGFTPYWAKKPTYIINARSEGDFNKNNYTDYNGPMGILNKPMFKHVIKNKRCLIPFNGFIEGPEKEKLNKPYLIQFKDPKTIKSFAGIYDEWINKSSGEVIRGFAIITTSSNPITEQIGHHRSPVILNKNQEKEWLDISSNINSIVQLLRPWNSTHEQLAAIPISPAIKNPSFKKIEKPSSKQVVLNQQIELFGMGESRSRKR